MRQIQKLSVKKIGLGIGVLFATLTLSLAFQNCGTKANFGLTEQGQLEAQGIFDTDFSFAPSTSSTQPVDLIWVIDNSGSMNEEAARVRQNFQAFAARLETTTDFKLALISKAGTSGLNVSLPFTGNRYMQIDTSVGSTNALDIVAKAICPVGKVCGTVTGTGLLTGFLRPLAKKIVVAVTDDESKMTADAFKAAFAAVYTPTQLSVFGFIGLATQPSCTISKVGSVYKSLAASTGGATYDICLNDWSQTFISLGDSVVAISQNTMVLPQTEHPVIGILSVTLNGVLLKATDYSLKDRVITINPAVLANIKTANVHVQYQLKMP